jgi:pimeloyl-ACP methyl ester carboxylesterase
MLRRNRPLLVVRITALLVTASTGAAFAAELPRRGLLGARLVPPQEGQTGAKVTRVEEGSAAARAGLAAGDVVHAIEGETIGDADDHARALRRVRAGDLTLLVERDGKQREVKVQVPPWPALEVSGAKVEYGTVKSPRGYAVRTILTVPEGASGRLPAIFLVPWLSCDSVEVTRGRRDGTAQLLDALAQKSGALTFRVDKPGIGDSGGPPCRSVDFHHELDAMRAGFQALLADPRVDPDQVFVLGLSNGGGYAPLVPGGAPVRGYVVIGGWSKTWFEHMIEHERRRLALTGEDPGEVTAAMPGYAEFYTEYLVRRRTPRQVLAEKPHLTPLWYDEPEHQYERPAAFYHQLQELNLAAAWAKTGAPVLAIHGGHDWIMSREDHQLIAELANRQRPGSGRFVAIARMDHGLFVHPTLQQGFDDYWSGSYAVEAEELILDWLRQQRAAPQDR